MFPFSFLIGSFIPSAHAQTLANAGQGGPGVSTMWGHICSILPCVTSSGGGSTLIMALSNSVITFIFPVTIVVAVIMVVYAGIRIIMSDGAEDKVSEAKKIILYAALGVILSIMTSAIVAFVTTYLGYILV